VFFDWLPLLLETKAEEAGEASGTVGAAKDSACCEEPLLGCSGGGWASASVVGGGGLPSNL
jgi:hypothetical protein